MSITVNGPPMASNNSKDTETPHAASPWKLTLTPCLSLQKFFSSPKKDRTTSVLKVLPYEDYTEAYTLDFIATVSDIPIPKVKEVRIEGGSTFLKIEFVPGDNLALVWGNMSSATQAKVVEQLKGWFEKLRAVEPDGQMVCSVRGGPIRLGNWTLGPYKNHDDFHASRRRGIPLEDLRFTKLDVFDAHRRSYKSKFTHGRFLQENVLVKKDGTITAILNWECAGWFPEYWEFVNATPSSGPSGWPVAQLKEIIGDYQKQEEADRKLW